MEFKSFGKIPKNSGGIKLRKRRRKEAAETAKPTCWKKKSIFFKLEYWKHLCLRHNLDVMHIEKNVCDSLIGTLLNIPGKSKDGISARLDLKEMKLRQDLFPVEVDDKRKYLPPACFTLNKDEKRRFCQILANVKVSEGYSSNIRNYVSMEELKLVGLKSHDYHILMQNLLPVAIYSILPERVRKAITRLCMFFNIICSKVVDVTKLRSLQDDIVVTLCLLEQYFPPSFFDIMVHLVVHLVREVKLGGPVYMRWMYPFERYMKVLKSYVRNANRPEGSMVQSYVAEEAIEFCSEYLRGTRVIGLAYDDEDEHLNVTRGISGGSIVTVARKLLNKAHRNVLQNSNDVQPYIE